MRRFLSRLVPVSLVLAVACPAAVAAFADEPDPAPPQSGLVSYEVDNPEAFSLSGQNFTMLALSWQSISGETQLLIRAGIDGTWDSWSDFATDGEFELEDGRTSTDAIWMGASDALEIRTTGDITELKVTLIASTVASGVEQETEPEVLAAPRVMDAPAAAASTSSFLSQPAIVTRAQWGAAKNPSGAHDRINPTIRAAAIHHTAGRNDYTKAEAASVIRGTQSYHISLGWGDIGYNFLVDRFGTIYEGHAGGIDLPVHGAHTAEFNVDTFAVSYMGNTETESITVAGMESIAQVVAWKLGSFYVDPLATVPLWITDPDVIADFDKPVTSLPAIFGHRDVHFTACPGKDLYSKFVGLRNRVASIIASATPSPIEAKWKELGGPDSGLGLVYRAEQPIGSGRWTQFDYGAIFWSPTTGAHVVTSEILTKYLASGGPTGALGFPLSDEQANQVTFASGTLTKVISADGVSVEPTTKIVPAMKAEKLGTSDTAKFIQALVPVAQHAESLYGVPTSVTLAQAILESGWGKSDLARWGQALFGIKCKAEASPLQSGCFNKDSGEFLNGQYVVQNSNFRAYNSLSASVIDHGLFLKENSRYAAAFTTTSADAFARAIHAAGYATAPDYSDRLITIMGQYNLYAYDLTNKTPTTVIGGISLPTTRNAVGEEAIWYLLNAAASFGELGFPVGSQVDGLVPGTRIQSFDRGIIMTSTKYGPHAIAGALWDKYRSDATARSSLGAVVGDATKGSSGLTQKFASGSLTATSVSANPDEAIEPGPLYRFYNWSSGSHFYTAEESEKNSVIDQWDYNSGKGPFRLDGVVGRVVASKVASEADQVVVYRFFLPSKGVHFYSSDLAEVEHVRSTWPEVFTYEGPAYVAYSRTPDGKGCAVAGTVPLYRFYNNDAGVHFYTADETERDSVIDQWDYASGKGPFSLDGIAYCILPK